MAQAAATEKPSIAQAVMPKGLSFYTEQPADPTTDAQPSEAVETPAGESTDSPKPEESAADDAPVSEDTETEETEEVPDALPEGWIEHDGERFSPQDLSDAIKAFKNMKDWQTSNTQKAQEIAEKRKTLMRAEAFIQACQQNSDLAEEFRAIIEDAGDEKLLESFDAALKYDPATFENPFQQELDDTKAQLEQANQRLTEQEFTAEKSALKTKFNLKDEQVQQVEDFVIQYFNDHHVALPLEEGYKLMEFPHLQERTKTTRRTPVKTAPKVGVAAINQPKPEVRDLRKAAMPDEFRGKFFSG